MQFLAFGLFFLLLSSCTSTESPLDRSTLRVAISAEPKTLDPRFATDAAGMRISNLLFNSLVRMGPELKLINDAAKSHKYENLNYQFVLRKNLTFHDGSALTPEDVVFSFDQYRSGRSPFRSTLDVIKNVDAKLNDLGEIEVAIQLNSFSATFLTDLSPVKLLPKKIIEAVGDDFARKPIGTGVFSLSHRSSNEIALKRVASHPLVTPKSEKLVFKIVRDDTTRALKLRKGEIDIAQNEIPPNKVKSFETNKDFTVHKFPGLSMSYMLVNLTDPVLKQKNVRTAIAKAINREEIIKFKLNGLAQTASSILTPANPFFFQAQKFSFDLPTAEEIITSLGLSSPTLELKTSNSQTAVQNGQILADQISKLGFQVKLKSYEWGTFYSDVQKGNFQLATMRWVGATDPDIYRVAFHSSELPPKGRNRGRYINAELDQLLTNGIRIENTQSRIQHYQKVQSIVQQDLPIIPLWYDKQVAIVHKSIKGYQPPLNGDFTPFIYVEKK